jgi:hypothetical protein
MSEHIWEEIVQSYLTTNRAVLVSRQYPISDEWEMYSDLLAVDFQGHQVWVVEVTGGANLTKIIVKAKQFKTEIEPRLRQRLMTFGIITAQQNWEFGFWGFVREEMKGKLLAAIQLYVPLAKVDSLQYVSCPWLYWDARRAEEKRPVSVTSGASL